ncbi:reverse transcriptase domain-containing protein [Tanacetum coccineum]
MAMGSFQGSFRGASSGFSELHQLDTFYNALNSNDQDSLNSAAGGNFLDKMPRECLKIIESKSKVRQSRNKAVVAKMSTSSSTQAVSSDVAELKGHGRLPAHNFNQANSGYRPPMVSNQIRPPGFPPVQNPHANSQNNFNRGNNFNQNRGNNFNQGQIYRPPVHQPVVNQPVAHQGPAPQTHGVSKTDFERYVTANDAVLRNMQNQGQNLQSQMANLTDMLSKFVTANTASTSGSGTLPGNTVTNPKEDLKGITTRSGVTIQGPKACNHDTEVTKDTMPPANNGSTEDVQPPVVQIQTRNPNPEPNVAPVVTPASIPFPSRRNDERRKEKANDQIEKFYEIFRDLSFEISFTDHLPIIEPELGNLTMDVVNDIFPTREPRVHVPNVLPTHPPGNGFPTISRIVKTLLLAVFHKSFTSSASFWESRTDNQEKDEKQSQNDKTGLGMEKTVKDKAKSIAGKELHFELSFADALLHMPKFASMFKSLLNNKEKLFDLAKTPVNENCSAVILKKLPEKLGDPGKFLIPCDFPELVECLALADLGASINLMPLSIWKKLSLPELTPTQMILELADRSTTSPSGIAEDVFVKVGKFHFPADFVVVDYVVDPRVPLILGRPFLRTARALIDVYGEELTLRVDDEAITFKVGQTSRYSYNDAVSINRIDVIDVACEEYAQEVLGFSDSSTSGNPTPSLDPILSTSSPSLTPFEEGDFILEEIEACLTNDSIPPGIDDDNFDPEGDLLLLEKLLNDDPSSPLSERTSC